MRIIGTGTRFLLVETLMPMVRIFHMLGRSLLVVLAFVLGVAAAATLSYRVAQLHDDALPRRVVIPLGAGPLVIASALERAGIKLDPVRLSWIIRLRGDGARYRAALYDVPGGQSLKAFLDALARGEGQPATLRLIEGLTFRQVRELVDHHPHLMHDARSLDEPALLARIGAPGASAEGLFLPDTYHFAPGASALTLYRDAWRAMDRVLQREWPRRSPGLPLESPYQALVLASMIEKETGRAEDRSMVASVFVNRLKKGMLLQSDPTTLYALGPGFEGRLRRRDLQIDHPHNTYVRPGLPPTPIALPGRGAIEAALQPAESTALYFVARGDGSSEFSNDLKAHQRAVDRYILKR